MFEITRGYKQGRAVMFYDLLDAVENKTLEMVCKEHVVKLCNEGSISNAKIQMWEGKPIVRVQNSNLPLVKIDNSGQIIGEAHKTVRNGSENRIKHEEVIPTVKSTVVGKINPKKASRQDTAYTGYDYKHIVAKQDMNKSVSYKELSTVNDLFNIMASEFGLHQIELYRDAISKKVNLDKKLDGMNLQMIMSIQSSMATYLMNMAHNEINTVYMKYHVL